MAEAEATAHVAKTAGKGFGALGQKVGPLPLYAWVGAFIVIWWYFQKKGSASTPSGQATDPAGNTGTIDPSTGFVYGSPQDQAALAGQSVGAGGGDGSPTSGTSGPGGSTIGGNYPDNQSWGRAAINYLVGLGVDPTASNEAIQQYLSSQSLTPSQQGEVNLAIQALGAPPTPPGPVGVTPPPVVTPPGTPPPGGNTGKVMATNPPTGFTVTSKGGSSIGLKWNAAKNATGYTVAYDVVSGSQKNQQKVTGVTTTIGGLKPNTAYYFEVWADPTKTGGAHAGPILGHTTAASGSSGGSSGGGAKSYTVKNGDTLSGIAAKLKYPGGWQALYAKNKSVIGSNPNLIKPGEVLSL